VPARPTAPSAYVTFLEVQLERVSQTVMNTSALQDRVEKLEERGSSWDEQVTSMSQLIKLLQNYTEAQEEDMITVKRSLNQLHT